jgi:hypothetical protein
MNYGAPGRDTMEIEDNTPLIPGDRGTATMDVENDIEVQDMIIRSGVTPISADELVYNVIPRSAISADHDQLYAKTYGVNLSSVPTTLPRLYPSASPDTAQFIAEARRGVDRKLVGFLFVAVSKTDTSIDVLSVCRNLDIPSAGILQKLLKASARGNQPPKYIFISVIPFDTDTMTELGTLLLYTSLGFTMVPQQYVQDIMGTELQVISQPDANTLRVRTQSGVEDTVYIGSVRSVRGTRLVMSTIPAELVKPPRTLMHVTRENIANDFSKAVIPTPKEGYFSLHHMGLRQSGRFLETFTLPSNVTLITFTMPGSYLYGSSDGSGNIFRKMIDIMKPWANPILLKKFPGYANFPIYAIGKRELDEAPTQFAKTLLMTKFMLQFERRRIVTMCLSKGYNHKQSQYDIQTYAPGMTCLNYTMEWDPSSTDKARGITVTQMTTNKELPEIEAQIVIGKGMTLKRYVDLINARHPDKSPIMLMVFGCADVTDAVSRDYSLFYELSHRRALNYRVSQVNFPNNIAPYLTSETGVPTESLATCDRPKAGRRTRKQKKRSNRTYRRTRDVRRLR